MFSLITVGSEGKHVYALKACLTGIGYLDNSRLNDDRFTEYDQRALIKYQENNGLVPDGVFGPKTMDALVKSIKKELNPQTQAVRKTTIITRKWLYSIFGDFLAPGWETENIIYCDLSPFKDALKHIVLSWNSKIPAFEHRHHFGFRCHRLVAPQFFEVFKELTERELTHLLTDFGGCFCIRRSRGSHLYSFHSWGVAIDLNVKDNPFGSKGKMDKRIVEVFDKYGFLWGGKWERPDPMHFQISKLFEDKYMKDEEKLM